MTAATTPASEQMVFSPAIAPIGVFFALVPAFISLAALVAIIFNSLPLSLIALLLGLVGCCTMLIKRAVGDMCQVTVEWSPQGLTIHRLFGGATYPWTHIERIEMLDPGATFADFGRHEELRAGVGLFLRDPSRKERLPGDPPDVLVLSRCGGEAERIPKLTEKLSAAKRGANGGRDIRKIGAPPTIGAPKQAKAGKSGKGFRRNAAAG